MSWAKIHTDILGDPKLLQAARKGTRGLELLPWLIVFAKQADAGGRLAINGEAAEPVDIARLLPGVSKSAVARCMASCESLGVLEADGDGVLRFTTWEERQGRPSETPDAWRDRKAKSRDRKKKRHAPTVTPGHAGHEAGQGHVVSRDRGEVEVEVEVEESGATRDIGRDTANWPARFAAIYATHIGQVEPGEIGKHLAPAVKLHGEEAVERALTAWATQAPRTEKPQFLNPKAFARQASAWVEKTKPIPTYAENGIDPSPEFLDAMGRKP